MEEEWIGNGGEWGGTRRKGRKRGNYDRDTIFERTHVFKKDYGAKQNLSNLVVSLLYNTVPQRAYKV